MLLFFCLLGALVLTSADQLIKSWVAETLQSGRDISIIKDVLILTYTENYGAAFSILQGYTTQLSILTAIIIVAALWALITKRITHPAMMVGACLIIAGGGGNLIDRLTRGFVVDYIYFMPINFPVFNLADICVVSGTALIIIYLLFFEQKQTIET